MKEISILINREDAAKAEAEERDIFIRDILEKVGIPLDDIWPEEGMTVENKVKFRDLMKKFDVDIRYDGDRGVKIYIDDDVIAEWYKPKFVMQKDITARKPSDRLFYEMIIKYSSLFDGEENG